MKDKEDLKSAIQWLDDNVKNQKFSENATYWLNANREDFDIPRLINALTDGEYLKDTDLTENDAEDLYNFLKEY